MKTSSKGIELIKEHEGFSSRGYLCPAGKWTIGYGHTGGVKSGDVISKWQAEELLRKDVLTAERALNRQRLPLSQNQFDALVSFTFNVGVGNFQKSTLLRKVRVNVNDPSIAVEFKKWVYGGGKVLPGLVKRRQAEAGLYFS